MCFKTPGNLWYYDMDTNISPPFSIVIACIQEAAYIFQGSALTRKVMNMALQAQNDLWNAVTAVSCSAPYFLNMAARLSRARTTRVIEMRILAWMSMQGDAEQYASVCRSLRMVPKARGERRPSVPLRLYIRQNHGGDR